VTIEITLPADMLTQVAEAAERIEDAMPTQHRLPHAGAAGCVEAVRAPNGIPTAPTQNPTRRELTLSTTVEPFGGCQWFMKEVTGSARATIRTSPRRPCRIWSILPAYS
jgi:hypothetical protein